MGFLNEKNGINNEIAILMEEVSKLVSEAQCVNLELVNAEKEVLNEVEIRFNEVIVTDHYMAYGVNNYKITFSKTLFGADVNFLCAISQGKNYQCIENFLKIPKNRVKNCFLINKDTFKPMIVLHIYYVVDKMVYIENKDAIFHELEHCFQYAMRLKNIENYNPLLNDKTNYETALKMMESNDVYEKYVGVVYYLSDYSEQDAIVQGLQGELQGLKSFFVYDKYEDSKTRVYLENLENGIRFLKKRFLKNKSKYKANEVCKKLGLTCEQLINIGENALQRLRTKIGKVISFYTFNPLDEMVRKPLFNKVIDETLEDIRK